MTTPHHEAQWVLRAQLGDRAAIETLLDSVQAPLRRFLRGIVGAADADDVLQDVLVLIFRKLIWLDDPALFRPWAYRIASRTAFRWLKRRRRWSDADAGEAALEALPAPAADASDELLAKLAAMDGLSPASRAVLVLHFQEEMSLADAAAVLEIPLGTAKSRLAYGLAALRRLLDPSRSFR